MEREQLFGRVARKARTFVQGLLQKGEPFQVPSDSPRATTPAPDWLPDWRALIADNKRLWDRKRADAQKTGQKVLIATATGGHPIVTAIDSLVGIALTLRGCEVHFMLCDKFLPACLQVTIWDFPEPKEFLSEGPKRHCDHCLRSGLEVYEMLGLPIHRFSKYVNDVERGLAADLSKSLPFAEIPAYKWRDIPVGFHAHQSALRYLAVGDLNCDEDGESVLRRYFEGAILATQAAHNLLEAENFDCIDIFHGQYVPHGALLSVATERRTRFAAWALSCRAKNVFFTHQSVEGFALTDEIDWDDFEFTPAAEKQIMDYFNGRANGLGDWFNESLHKEAQGDLEILKTQLNIDFERPTIGLLTNVIWDAEVVYRDNAFSSQIDWLIQTIDYFSHRHDLQLLIRIHPAELKYTLSRQLALDEIKRAFPILPPNVFVVPPESPANTYVLMSACEAVIIFSTTMGMELSSQGMPVICVGPGEVRGKGISYDASNEHEYKELLDKLPFANRRLDRATVQRARKFAFHFFFRRSVPVDVIEFREGWPCLSINVKSLNQLLPGNDMGLDKLCNGLMDSAPFIYPAEKFL